MTKQKQQQTINVTDGEWRTQTW